MDMNVNTALTNMPDANIQGDLQSNDGANISGQETGQQGGNASQGLSDQVTVTESGSKQAATLAKDQANNSKAQSPDDLFGSTGVIAVDEDKNVVVRFYDKSGKMLSQYPPEDYLKMMKQLNQTAENLFHVKA